MARGSGRLDPCLTDPVNDDGTRTIVTVACRASNRETHRPKRRFYDRVPSGYIGVGLEHDGARYIPEAVSPDYIAQLSKYGLRQ